MMYFKLNYLEVIKYLFISLLFCNAMSTRVLGQDNVDEQSNRSILNEMSRFQSIFNDDFATRDEDPAYFRCTTGEINEPQLRCIRLYDVGIEDFVAIPFAVNFDAQSINIFLAKPKGYRFHFYDPEDRRPYASDPSRSPGGLVSSHAVDDGDFVFNSPPNFYYEFYS